MGVDFLVCNHCKGTFPDCGEYVSCDCGTNWCDDECAEKDGFKTESCTLGYDVDDNDCENSCDYCENRIDSSCKYCRGEDFEDVALLDFALSKLCLTREQLIEQYKLLNSPTG